MGWFKLKSPQVKSLCVAPPPLYDKVLSPPGTDCRVTGVPSMPITSASEANGMVFNQTESIVRLIRKVRTVTSVNTKGLTRRVSCSDAMGNAKALHGTQKKAQKTITNLSLCPMVCVLETGFEKNPGQTTALPLRGTATLS